MDYRISDPRIAELLKAKKKELNNTPSSSDSEIKSVNSEIKNKEAKVKDELASRPKNTKKEENFYKKFKSPKEVKKKKKRLKPPSTKDLALVTKQLASMVNTGLPLLEALDILSDSTQDKTLKYVFKEASISISKGSTLLNILESYPEVFDEMYLALVAAGEEAGLLPDVLERESKLLESLAKIKGQISSAMAYPIAIFTLTIVVIIIMLLFVIPVFVDLYKDSGTSLPFLTNMLVVGSNKLRDFSFLAKIFPFLFLIYFVGKREVKKNYFINWKDEFLLKVPIVKDLVTKSSLANFARTLSALNSAGVPILEALTISKGTLGNRVFRRIINRMNTEIQAGQPIYKVLSYEKYIPIMFTSMFRIGEETGELSGMVSKLADFYEEEVSTSVKSLTSVLEPLMIVFVAGVVAVILVAMYLPMFNMMSTVG